MPTSIVQSPPELSFSRNRTVCAFQPDSLFTNVGSKAICEVYFSTGISEGKQLIISYGTNTLTFDVVTDPLVDGQQLPAGPGTQAFVGQLLPYFKANYFLSRDFVITTNTDPDFPRIIFTAKQEGKNFNFLEIPHEGGKVRTTKPGVDPIRKKNFSLLLEVALRLPGSADTYVAYSETLPYVDAQPHPINLSDILHAELTIDRPDIWSSAEPFRHPNSTRRYTLTYAEASGERYTLGKPQSTTEFAVVMGGTPPERGDRFTPLEFGQGTEPAADRAMRYGSVTRYVQPDEPQWLSFVNLRTAAGIAAIEVRCEYNNNTSATLPIIRLPGNTLNRFERCTFPVGFSVLNLRDTTVLPTQVRSYYVRLLLDGRPASVEYRYVVDYANRENKQYFVYLNSLGCWDSFCAYGQSAYGLDWTNKQVERYLPPDYRSDDAQTADVLNVTRQTFAVATGDRTAAQLDLLDDFFASAYRYRYLNGQCRAITLKAASLPKGRDDQNQYNHTFEYSYSTTNPIY